MEQIQSNVVSLSQTAWGYSSKCVSFHEFEPLCHGMRPKGDSSAAAGEKDENRHRQPLLLALVVGAGRGRAAERISR